MLSFFLSLRSYRKAMRTAKIVRMATELQIEETIRNAMAYAWEIGSGGSPMYDQINATPVNPFLQKDWRQGVITGSEA